MVELIAFFGTPQINFILVLIAIDVVLGIIAAFMRKEFRLGKLAGFMKGPVLAYVFGFVVLQMVATALPSLVVMVSAAYLLIVLALIGSILTNLAKMGLPIPHILQRG